MPELAGLLRGARGCAGLLQSGRAAVQRPYHNRLFEDRRKMEVAPRNAGPLLRGRE